ncbi:hypothetical protein [Marinomonas sp. ef1]|uniref:hypothetical protein n=1 Tax=Marinomonas sp. ef1 TaxID=2005043 RepID=UPI000C28FF76|nr:hypothetical protein [Marinomonas sp. ef1]
MSNVIDSEVKPTRIKLLSLCAGLLIFSTIISLATGTLWPWLLPLALVLFVFAAFAPLRLMFVIRGMDYFHLRFRKVLMWCLFHFFVVPSCWLLRLVRPSIIALEINKKTVSYWGEAEKKTFTVDDFTKQY